ncbi:MAG: PVC-type heme-binding CxxCH protein [Fuerstiella sp.]
MNRLTLLLIIISTSAVIADDIHDATNATKNLDVADGLQVQLLASEPKLLSPSNIDVDHLGRIWVCEVVNYRHFANKDNPAREAGDRILVMEDTNNDGSLDKQTTFYQGPEIDSAHGVCVLGNRVIVSAGASVFDFYDDDGDLKADRKEVLFSGIQGSQHDHGIHSFTFGPDGRLYFNFGNAGKTLCEPDGSPVIDIAGNKVDVSRQPYQEGMAFRCELDGSKVDTLGWNFRNNWELCVDSFGAVWQSDNDDDGNKGVRINFVMEYGNYGYKDELTGAGWREPRTGWETDIPRRHWHLNDPGVVPNLLQTGAGSPTGILIYEGDLLPKRFHNQLIHCDAGPNIVRSYVISNDAAGYSAATNDILKGSRDQWFRPSDVCVAPDGSLIVADWYDPGVGGHRQGDIEKGRLFRIAPTDSRWQVPNYDIDSIAGAIKALKSPNVSARYLAFQRLQSNISDSEDALAEVFRNDSHPRHQARALWLLGQYCDHADSYINEAFESANSNIRMAALRLVRRTNNNVADAALHLANDSSAQVRREVAIALRHMENSPKKAKIWAKLANQYSPGDRWYLEALGIGAEGYWDQCMEQYSRISRITGNPHANKVAADLIWRSRGEQSVRFLANQIKYYGQQNDAESAAKIPAVFRALDFHPANQVQAAAENLLSKTATASYDGKSKSTIVAEALQRLGINRIKDGSEAKAALDTVLDETKGTALFIKLVKKFELQDRYTEVLDIAQATPHQQLGVEAIVALLRARQWNLIYQALNSKDITQAIATATVLENSRDGAIGGIVVRAAQDKGIDIEVRRACVRAASQVSRVASDVATLYEQKKLDSQLSQALAAALHSAPSRSTREIAGRLFPLPPSKQGKPLPSIQQLASRQGNVPQGKVIFDTTGTCLKCHVVKGEGKEIGPNLSEIGSKLSVEAMFESIIYPSAGISHNYEAYTLILTNGTSQTGLITSETDDSLSMKGDDGIVRTFKINEVDEKVKQKTSLMPADLQKLMTVQDIVDTVAYLQTLKKK